MTLKRYDADKLDQLALRVLDISLNIREISTAIRRQPDVEFAAHDKKALEWLSQLERWSAEAKAKLEMAAIRQRGVRKAALASEKLRA